MKTAAALAAVRLPVPVSGPQLLVGERSRGWLRRSRRSAIAVPLAQRLPRRVGTCLALAFLSLSVGYGSVLGGQLETLRATYGEPHHVLAKLAGFGIDRVTISGIAELSEEEVLVAAGIDPKISLAFFDADQARKRLEATPLIREAAVRKLYPGEISITLTEREPFALWQVKGDLFVIAADGTVIDKMDDGRFAHLPLVVGATANLRAKEYLALRTAAGSLAPRIRAATLVAGRRWTLKLDNGMDVRLPEEKPGDAVKRLAGLETDFGVLDRDVLAIDLRQTDRVVMRLTEEGASARADQLKIKTKKKGGRGVNLTSQGLTPRMRPLSSRKSATLSILDIGTSKVVCLIAELNPAEANERLRGRTHVARIIGIGHQRSLGLKGGAIIDLESAERAIRAAVDAAERMAKVEVQSVIVNLTGGRLGSQHYAAGVDLRAGAVGDGDVKRVLAAAATHAIKPGKAVLHALPTGYALDGSPGVLDPRGLIGSKLSVDMHVVASEASAARNVMLAVERCHLEVEAVVATPYASGLSVLVDDEAEMGVVVVDMGGGTTSLGVFAGGHLMHADAIAVGGNHITMDVARGLSTRVAAAERLKTLHGSAIASASDERDMISVPQVDDDERDVPNHLAKSHLVRIIKPRVEEILELVRDRLANAGFSAQAGRRVVLTGGACQLTGLPEAARRILGGQIRTGRPLGIRGLPEAGKGPAFAAAVGLLVYPQVAHVEHFEPRASGAYFATGTDGYFSRVGRWLKESF